MAMCNHLCGTMLGSDFQVDYKRHMQDKNIAIRFSEMRDICFDCNDRGHKTGEYCDPDENIPPPDDDTPFADGNQDPHGQPYYQT